MIDMEVNKFQIGDKVKLIQEEVTEQNTEIDQNVLDELCQQEYLTITNSSPENSYEVNDYWWFEEYQLKSVYINNSHETLSQLIDMRIEEYLNKPLDVKIKRIRSDIILPTYAHDTDAGVDLQSAIDITLEPHTYGTIIPTGIAIQLPKGTEAQVRAKSGNSCKTTLRISNSLGTVDEGFIGEIGVIVDNIGDEPIVIPKGKGIAQLILKYQPKFNFIEVDELIPTDRGEGGYGSSNRGI